MIQILAGSALDGFFEETTDAIIRALTPKTRLAILKLKKPLLWEYTSAASSSTRLSWKTMYEHGRNSSNGANPIRWKA